MKEIGGYIELDTRLRIHLYQGDVKELAKVAGTYRCTLTLLDTNIHPTRETYAIYALEEKVFTVRFFNGDELLATFANVAYGCSLFLDYIPASSPNSLHIVHASCGLLATPSVPIAYPVTWTH